MKVIILFDMHGSGSIVDILTYTVENLSYAYEWLRNESGYRRVSVREATQNAPTLQ